MMRKADPTTLWRALRLRAVQLPYQAVGNTARQNALNCTSVKVSEGLRCQAKFLQPPEVEEALLRLLHHTVCVGGLFQIVSDVYAEDLEAFYLLYFGPVNVDRGVLLTLTERLISCNHSARALTSSL